MSNCGFGSYADMLGELADKMPCGTLVVVAVSIDGRRGTPDVRFVTVDRWADNGWMWSDYGGHGFGDDAEVFRDAGGYNFSGCVPAGDRKHVRIIPVPR